MNDTPSIRGLGGCIEPVEAPRRVGGAMGGADPRLVERGVDGCSLGWVE